MRIPALLLAALIAPLAARAQQPVDSACTARIRELTPTDPHWKFTTELVDHLPASSTVPSPLKVLGYVPGTIGKLSRTEDLNRYFRAVAAASPRVKLFSLGMSEEGREMIVAAVGDEATIARLDDYRAMAAKLADPRGVSDAERTRLVHESKPIYWLSGTIHAPETGSPEMLMELLYRLAVEETPFVQDIRRNVITLITPATEVDGRNRIVDLIEEEKQLKLGRGGIPSIYWGKYIAHDNNRDGFNIASGTSPGGDAMDAASRAVAQNVPDREIERQSAAQRARVILRFTPKADSLLISGLLDNGSEMAGRGAVVDAPMGKGHVVLFGIRPLWRYETQGSYAMLVNAMANWNALDVNQQAAR